MSVPFMQGQLLGKDTDDINGAADKVYSSTGAWYPIANADVPANYLQLPDYVAPCDGMAALTMFVRMWSATAGQSIGISIQEYLTTTVIDDDWLVLHDNSHYQSGKVVTDFPIVAGTTYRFVGYIYLVSAGNLTVARTATSTFLKVKYFANP